MTEKMRFTIFLFSIFTTTVLLANCDSGTTVKPSGNVVRIGVIAPLSGPDRQWGESGLLGIRTLLKIWPCLANGDKPEHIVEDDGDDPVRTAKALQKLVKDDGVSAVLIFSRSSAVLPTIALIDRLETPTLVLLATHPGITGSPWLNQLIFDDVKQGTVAALYVRDELLKNSVAVFRESADPHSRILADIFTSTFLETGGRVEMVAMDDDGGEYGPLIERLQAAGIEFLYVPVSAGRIVDIRKAINDIDWDPGIMASDGVLSQFLLQHEGNLSFVDGILATDLYNINLRKSPYGKRVNRIFKKNYHAPGTTFTAAGCEGIAILMSAMDRCEVSDDKTCIQNMLRSPAGFVGLLSRIHIQDNGKVERPIYINSIKNQRLFPVVKVY